MSIDKLINKPGYLHLDFHYDLPETKEMCWRVAKSALPFLMLYKPLSAPLSIGLGSVRVFNAVIQTKDAKTLLETTVSVAALASVVFKHPLGMLISSAHDLVINVKELLNALEIKDYKKACEITAHILNNSAYLALYFSAASELMILSLSLQILLELYHSFDELKEGKYLEGTSHFLMGLIRGHQLKIEVEVLKLQRSIDAYMDEFETETNSDNNGLNMLKATKNKKVKKAKKDKKVKKHKKKIKSEPVKPEESKPTNEDRLNYKTDEELTKRARDFFSDPTIKNKKPVDVDFSKVLTSHSSDEQIIDAVLKDYQGFCVGECHTDEAAKRFMIDKMPYLKEKNIKVIFLEGLDHAIQPTVDNYISKHLRDLNSTERQQVENLLYLAKYGFKKHPTSPYTFFALMEKAKQVQMRLIGIDYNHSFNKKEPTATSSLEESCDSSYDRLTKMNYIAEKVIKATLKNQDPQNKFVAFMGAAHASRYPLYSTTIPSAVELPGVASVPELLQVPAVVISDKSLGMTRTVAFNQKVTRFNLNVPFHILINT